MIKFQYVEFDKFRSFVEKFDGTSFRNKRRKQFPVDLLSEISLRIDFKLISFLGLISGILFDAVNANLLVR